MNTNSQLTLANRKQLADLLSDRYDSLRYRTKQKFQQTEEKLRESFIRELADKNGASKVIAQITATKNELEELEDELHVLGFDLDDDGLSLRQGSDSPLYKSIEKRVEKELGTTADIDARFDSTMVAMMTVATLADAEKLLKSVTNMRE
jgi:hypothetical protein